MNTYPYFMESTDRFAVVEDSIYPYCPDEYGGAKPNNHFFESKLKLKATTRNCPSVNELPKPMQTK